jgi:hypothetical protein
VPRIASPCFSMQRRIRGDPMGRPYESLTFRRGGFETLPYTMQDTAHASPISSCQGMSRRRNISMARSNMRPVASMTRM